MRQFKLLTTSIWVLAGCLLAARAVADPAAVASPSESAQHLPSLQQVLDKLESAKQDNSPMPATGSASQRAATVKPLQSASADVSMAEQSLEALANGAGDFARGEHGNAERVEVSLTPVDRRLRLKRCDTTPVFSWTSATNTIGNTSITAVCEGSAPWKILIRAQVRVFQQIPVLAVPVNKGDVLQADMVASRLLDVSALRRETLRSIDNVLGYQFKRQLAAGREIVSSVLAAPIVVSKGDAVLISTSNQVLDVQMKGTALSGGVIGKKINVRSNSSGRIIQTWIKGPGQVEVSP